MPTTILSPGTPNSDEPGWTAYSLLVILPPLTGDSLGELIFTLLGPNTGTDACYADHISVGVWSGTLGDTVAPKVEVTFSSNQAHGASLVSQNPGSVVLASDPVPFTTGDGAVTGARLVLTFDFTASPPSAVYATKVGVTGASSLYVNSAATYNVQAPANQNANTANTLYMCSLVQTQAAPGGGTKEDRAMNNAADLILGIL